MSLISTASVWTNDEPQKKRTPTMRKTIKKMPTYMNSVGEPDEYVSQEQNYRDMTPETIDDLQISQESRTLRVTELLNKVNGDNDGNKLVDFKPLSNPEINIKKPDNNGIRADETLNYLTNPLQNSPPYVQKREDISNYSANNLNLATLSNYNMSYEAPTKLTEQPYYAKLGLGNSNTDNKLMEKINYMVHMMEEQQGERTQNITEEFILYTFLGVFIIFVVDSFARSGRYIR